MSLILLALIFSRPFISSLAFPCLNSIHSILLLCMLCIWLVRRKITLKKTGSAKIPLLLFIFAMITSLVFSQNKTNSFAELYKYITAALLFIACVNLSEEDKRRMLLCIMTPAVIISILAIYQYFFGFRHLLNYMARNNLSGSFAMDYITQKRVFFPFVTPNILGGYLAMALPLALYYKRRFLLLLPLASAFLLTKSLGAFFSLFTGIAAYLFLRGKFKKEYIIFLALSLLAIGVVFISRMSSEKAHLQPAFSTVMRLGYWSDALNIIKAHPLVGVGLGNFNAARASYAHNSYLQLWAEMGIFGLFTFLWFAWEILRAGFRQPTYLFTAAIVFLMHNLIDFSFFLPEVALIWWALAGLTIKTAESNQ